MITDHRMLNMSSLQSDLTLAMINLLRFTNLDFLELLIWLKTSVELVIALIGLLSTGL